MDTYCGGKPALHEGQPQRREATKQGFQSGYQPCAQWNGSVCLLLQSPAAREQNTRDRSILRDMYTRQLYTRRTLQWVRGHGLRTGAACIGCTTRPCRGQCICVELFKWGYVQPQSPRTVTAYLTSLACATWNSSPLQPSYVCRYKANGMDYSVIDLHFLKYVTYFNTAVAR